VALKQPQVIQRFNSLGTEAVTSTPEAFDQLIKDEIQLFKKLAPRLALRQIKSWHLFTSMASTCTTPSMAHKALG
jgi:hypothetical protein